MRADLVKAPPDAPLDWVCVECGEAKRLHSGQRFWCKPLEILERISANLTVRIDAPMRSETWKKFR